MCVELDLIAYRHMAANKRLEDSVTPALGSKAAAIGPRRTSLETIGHDRVTSRGLLRAHLIV